MGPISDKTLIRLKARLSNSGLGHASEIPTLPCLANLSRSGTAGASRSGRFLRCRANIITTPRPLAHFRTLECDGEHGCWVGMVIRIRSKPVAGLGPRGFRWTDPIMPHRPHLAFSTGASRFVLDQGVKAALSVLGRQVAPIRRVTTAGRRPSFFCTWKRVGAPRFFAFICLGRGFLCDRLHPYSVLDASFRP